MTKACCYSAVLMLAATVSGCGGGTAAPDAGRDTASSPVASTTPPATPEPVDGTGMERAPTAGAAQTAMEFRLSQGSPSYLVDASGASLYFVHDNRDGKRCDEICEDAWPPVLANASQASAGQGVAASKLGTIPRGDGGLQVTYAQQPLYRYAGDSGAGRTAGHEVKDRWGNWSLITPAGEPLPGQPNAQNERDRPGGVAAPQ